MHDAGLAPFSSRKQVRAKGIALILNVHVALRCSPPCSMYSVCAIALSNVSVAVVAALVHCVRVAIDRKTRYEQELIAKTSTDSESDTASMTGVSSSMPSVLQSPP